MEVCKYKNKCGGCNLQGTDYEKQLEIKQKKVEELLGGFAKVEKIKGMDDPYHYRNKVQAAFGFVKGKGIVSGVYESRSHRIVDIETCQIEDEISRIIIRDIHNLLPSFKIRPYNEDSGRGLLRHVLVRRGFKTGEVMVVLVISSPVFPSKNNFVKALRKLHPEITTVVMNVNTRSDSMVLGERNITVYGGGFITDELCGKKFIISPNSFYQVNSIQTEKLYGTAIEYAGLSGSEVIIDAYSGIGTIGIVASDYCKNVISVELNPSAVSDAKKNASKNKVSNISFYKADAGEFMVRLAEEKKHIDTVFMDPPRAGSDKAFMSSVIKLAPDRVVYISCNPVTLKDNLKYFTSKGYEVDRIQPVDMFPFSEHIECVVSLTRQ
ncbi:MAG: 23S rRNA (uracil(1939)-C(5))-methyltransferase RlmD [Lachnospiraceae bacterium]|nr:23S rRNA (uracil(1939)-C(5))-methyltransferase RlmD [Lachnospiraceae bacterium]